MVRAVDGISFSVDAGEVVGYIGPNGAGKSTTIKLLTGVLEPTSGSVHVAGSAPSRNRRENAQRIGAVFGHRSQLWWDLPLVESMKLLAALYDVDPKAYRSQLAYLDQVLGLDEILPTPVRQLSLGQRMRGDLAAAFLHQPSVLYLDEPTIGLDVHAKDRVCGFIEQVSQERRATIVLTTHDLADIERLCDRVILIDRGTVAFDGPVKELKASYASERVLKVRYEAGGSDELTLGQPLASGTVVSAAPGEVSLRLPAIASAVPTALSEIGRLGHIVDLSIEETSLEEVIKQVYSARRAAAR
ncbi:ABC transporter ATP-binding protein [Streptomyces griseus]|nr:ABC transporter ATP-binding protein [Streptomyces globisporus]PPA39304.1 ABC transporter ATP-binding protein [Streptomyces griseus]RAN16690.1 ABC transporter ATP-binding protein [Streptomyces badius]RAN24557.1 ABC transporter ATP-binding protein [Streptomyces badius]GGW13076.1 ABC transporter ATP-binding protein [Streptomyces globisporus]